MIKIISVLNNKVICDIKPHKDSITERCQVNLDNNSKILNLGVEGDVLISSEDIDSKDLEEYQLAILEFNKQNS